MFLKSVFDQIAYEIDLFKRPFSLKILGKNKDSTYLGSLISIGIFVAIIFSIAQSNMVLHLNPNIIEKTLSFDASPRITFGGTGPFVFGIFDNNRSSYVDDSIFKIEMWSVLKVGGGAQPLSKKQFFSVNCQTVNCPPDLITQFRQFDFSNYRCLPQQDLTLEGDQDESTFLTFRFMLRICNNQTDGGICKSIDVIQKKLQDKFFYLNFPELMLMLTTMNILL